VRSPNEVQSQLTHTHWSLEEEFGPHVLFPYCPHVFRSPLSFFPTILRSGYLSHGAKVTLVPLSVTSAL
jgi:hypothetical protein